MPGFGLNQWGVGPFGGAGTISLMSIRVRGTNELLATFDAPPRCFDPLGLYDAKNVRKWRIIAVDPRIPSTADPKRLYTPPGAVVPTKQVWIGEVLEVADQPTQLRLRTVPQCEPGVTYEVTLGGLILGHQCEVLAGPASDRFVGRGHPPVPRGRITSRDPYVDWANPFWRGGAEGPGYWTINSAGEIELADGLESLKTRVYRRLVTVAGGFAFLGRSYGTQHHIGAQIRQDTLQRLAVTMREQVSQEPDVRSCSVIASLVRAEGQQIVEVQVTVQRISGRLEPPLLYRLPA
ncbi:MAG: hypothetical protein M0R28_17690 [Pigmentiphaga sp.]|nr:hypothetical protein [Pigmentiphaga sp.]